MTYTATRYARTPGQVHECPESGGYSRHNLIPEPGEPRESGVYVCPYDYDQERGARFQEQLEAEAATERRAQAERIAREQIEAWGGDPTYPVLEIATAAALAGLEARA